MDHDDKDLERYWFPILAVMTIASWALLIGALWGGYKLFQTVGLV